MAIKFPIFRRLSFRLIAELPELSFPRIFFVFPGLNCQYVTFAQDWKQTFLYLLNRTQINAWFSIIYIPFFSFILASYLINVPYTDYQD